MKIGGRGVERWGMGGGGCLTLRLVWWDASVNSSKSISPSLPPSNAIVSQQFAASNANRTPSSNNSPETQNAASVVFLSRRVIRFAEVLMRSVKLAPSRFSAPSERYIISAVFFCLSQDFRYGVTSSSSSSFCFCS